MISVLISNVLQGINTRIKDWQQCCNLSDVHCTVEVDSFGQFSTKAKTKIASLPSAAWNEVSSVMYVLLMVRLDGQICIGCRRHAVCALSVQWSYRGHQVDSLNHWLRLTDWLPASLPSGQHVGTAFTQWSKMGFFAPQRQHNAPINVIFGTEQQTVHILVPYLTFIAANMWDYSP